MRANLLLLLRALPWFLGPALLLGGTGVHGFPTTRRSATGWSRGPSPRFVVEPTTTREAPVTESAPWTQTPPSLGSPPAKMDVLADLAVPTEGIPTAPPETSDEYRRGLFTIGAITLIFSSNSPVLHAAFSSSSEAVAAPPVLLLNAAVSIVALVGLLLGGESLESNTPLPSTLEQEPTTAKTMTTTTQNGESAGLAPTESSWWPDGPTLRGGCELGLWKFLGTTANLYGLALTTAGHGALLIQLTTLIVPVVQGIRGVPVPTRIRWSVVLALAGVVCFTQDPTGTPSAEGDALCVVAAVFYATYDLRLFAWGQKVAPRRLITTKIGTQAVCSVLLLLAVNASESRDYLSSLGGSSSSLALLLPVVLWSGVAVNAVAPFLQVGGQQAIGPTRCQTIYASQPLWAALLSFVFLGETIGPRGWVGGTAFLAALYLAATAETTGAECANREA